MNVSVEKREIVGVLKTHFGNYHLLSWERKSALWDSIRFLVVDDEGFENNLFVHGDYTMIQCVVPVQVDVKFLTSGQPDLTKETID